jgi:soluble lytic murein transglycosylase-like protein
MQINVGVHGKAAKKSNKANVRTGIKLLEEYKGQYKTNRQALIAYNMGPRNAEKYCKSKPDCQTDYSRKVEKVKANLRKHFA